MIHPATHDATNVTYYGVEMKDSWAAHIPVLSQAIRNLAPDIDPAVGWYWTDKRGQYGMVCFQKQEHARLFLEANYP